MNRTKIVAVGIAMAGLVGAAPGAFAHGWPGTEGSLQHFEPEIPAGALPPGGAVAEIDAGANRYRVRFEMPAAGSARVSLWNDLRSGLPQKQEVVVRSDRGAVFRTAVETSRISGGGPPLFLGSADDLAAFSRAASGSAHAKGVMDGIELGARSEIAAPDCRRLASVRYVVVVLADGQSAAGVLACAARGANLLIVGRLEAVADPGTSAFARLHAGHPAVAWGFGAVAWLPDMRDDVALAVTQVEAAGRSSGVEAMLTDSYWGFLADDEVKPKGVPGSTLVLVLLALYVAVIGPVGYFVGVRPRRAWLAWGWFPMVALGATIVLAVASTMWHGRAAALMVTRVSLVSPNGVGLEAVTVRLEGNGAGRHAISLPWRDGDMRSVDRGYRFGTPFAPPAGSLTLTDDRVAGRISVDGLAVGRHGTAGAAWVAAAERRGVEVSFRDDQLLLVNRSERTLRRAFVSIAGRCGTIEELPAGAARAVTDAACAREIMPDDSDPTSAWHAVVMTRMNGGLTAQGSFMVVAESDGPVAVEATPALKVITHDVLVVRGPLSNAGRTP